MCLSAYWQLKLANERAKISADVVKNACDHAKLEYYSGRKFWTLAEIFSLAKQACKSIAIRIEFQHKIRNNTQTAVTNMTKNRMFVTAVCVLFLIKLRWPKKKNFYDTVQHKSLCTSLSIQLHLRSWGVGEQVVLALLKSVSKTLFTTRVALNFCGNLFCVSAIFCISRELTFAIAKDRFYLLGIDFCDFRKSYSLEIKFSLFLLTLSDWHVKQHAEAWNKVIQQSVPPVTLSHVTSSSCGKSLKLFPTEYFQTIYSCKPFSVLNVLFLISSFCLWTKRDILNKLQHKSSLWCLYESI